MWCNWGWMGGRMWWPHGFGFFSFLLMLAAVVFLVSLLRKGKQSVPHKLKCPACAGEIQPVYLRCPHCGIGLKHHCPKCAAIIEATWKFCPTCESEINKTE